LDTQIKSTKEAESDGRNKGREKDLQVRIWSNRSISIVKKNRTDRFKSRRWRQYRRIQIILISFQIDKSNNLTKEINREQKEENRTYKLKFKRIDRIQTVRKDQNPTIQKSIKPTKVTE
jgi:hypothetical protein